MIVIPPVKVTDGILISSNIVEPATEDLGATAWSSGAGYSLNAYVYRTTTHKIYQCAVAVTAASAASYVLPEVAVLLPGSSWVEVRPTNKWAMFDFTRNTKTESSTGTISVSLNIPGRFDAVALVGLENVTNANIYITYNSNTYTIYNGPVTTESLIKIGFPPFYDPVLTVVLTGTGTIKCRGLAFGIYKDIGAIQRNVDIDATNLSSVERDTYGNASVVRRRSIPRISLQTYIDAKVINSVSAIRDSLNATPAIWSGLDVNTSDNYFESLLIVGFYKTFKFSLDNHLGAIVDIELEEI